jgi:recombination protein RecR
MWLIKRHVYSSFGILHTITFPMGIDQQGLLNRLIREFVRLPGIGQKTAQRLAFHILKIDQDEAVRLAEAIRAVKEGLSFCRQCRNMAEGELCEFCLDPKRDRTKILVVEEPSTLYAIERAGGYRGLYHVLLGSLSPLEGIGPSDIHAHDLINRLKDGEVHEVILATNLTIEGEATAIYLAKLIKPYGARVSRIAYGIPVGMDIEYADEVTLTKSIEGRREF